MRYISQSDFGEFGPFERSLKVKIGISAFTNHASGVEMTLLREILMRHNFAVGMPTSLG